MINFHKVYGVRFLIFGLLINLFTGLFVSGAGENSHSLRDALELSFKNDKQLIIARQGVNIQKEIITEARSGANPSFSGLLSTKRDWAFDMESSSDNVSGSVLGSYTIYDSLLTQNKIKLELLTLKVLQSDLKQLEQTILFSTINAFLNVQRDKKFVELSEGNVTVLGKKIPGSY
jgi:outer membrane protein TolC